MKIIRNILASGTILSLFLLLSCRNSQKEKTSHEVLPPNTIEISADQYRMAGILLGKPESQIIRSTLEVNGTVNVTPQNIASVGAPLGGFIRSTSLVQGCSVTKGQVMAEIENIAFIDLQQNFLETKSKCYYAEIEYNRHNLLYKENVYSEHNVQQVETEYRSLKVQLNALKQKMLLLGIDPEKLTEDRITSVLPVYAPISGYLQTANVNIGKYMNPTDVLFEIVNPDHVVLELVVFEKDMQKIVTGQKLTFSLPDNPEITFTGMVYQAGKALDKDKTVKAYATIDQNDSKLFSGMYVNARIELRNQAVLAVPQEAIVLFNEKSYLFLYKGKRMENGKEVNDFEALEVRRGATDRGFTEIVLPDSTDVSHLQVVVKGAYSILSAWKNKGEMAC